MIPLRASKTVRQRRKRNTTASVTEWPVRSTRPAVAGFPELSGLRGNGRHWGRRFTLAFAAKDRVQFAAQKQEQTSQIHPGEQHDDGCKREISRIIAIVPCDVELKELCHRNPADREKNRPRQCLAHCEIILRCQEIKQERQDDQCQSSEWQI